MAAAGVLLLAVDWLISLAKTVRETHTQWSDAMTLPIGVVIGPLGFVLLIIGAWWWLANDAAVKNEAIDARLKEIEKHLPTNLGTMVSESLDTIRKVGNEIMVHHAFELNERFNALERGTNDRFVKVEEDLKKRMGGIGR